MAEYTKDTRFSWGWVVGGAVLIWVLQFFAGLFMIMVGMHELAAAGIALGAYLGGGFVIGWWSEGRTILEAGLATLLVVFIELGRGHAALGRLSPGELLFIYGVPFVAAIIGAWIGERVQGNVVRTSDD
ncbi:MAG TPA: hypothetical protein VGG74_08105 [Kofleriaceae bacterium]|jgi:hypothetical protein